MYELLKTGIKLINNLIVKSISTNEVSSTRLSSFLILAPIQMMILVIILIELVSFGLAVYEGKNYILSNEFIITFGMVLAHHLSILFSRTKNPSIKEIKNNINENNISSTSEETKDLKSDSTAEDKV